MSVTHNLVVFFGSLALTIISSIVLGRDLDRIGRRLHFSEALIGLLSALGADAPEISSAVAALLANKPEVGVGVVLGSNIFNLAGLLGLSALVVGRVRIGRQALFLDGSVAILITLIAAALIVNLISPLFTVILMCLVIVPYIALLVPRAERIARARLPTSLHRLLDRTALDVQEAARRDQVPPHASWAEFLSIVPALVSVVLGSFGMVQSAVELGAKWKVSGAVIGTLILAGLTSLPNVVTALRLALHGRGAAVISETLNSNTLNLLAGLCAPALVFATVSQPTPHTILIIWWLLVMTIVSLSVAYIRGGVQRLGGLLIVLIYVAFAVVVARWQ